MVVAHFSLQIEVLKLCVKLKHHFMSVELQLYWIKYGKVWWIFICFTLLYWWMVWAHYLFWTHFKIKGFSNTDMCRLLADKLGATASYLFFEEYCDTYVCMYMGNNCYSNLMTKLCIHEYLICDDYENYRD